MSNFDLTNLAIQALCPGNEILYDDKGIPSIMVKIPKMTFAQLGLGSSTATFPAFLVNGQEVDEIYISKYMNIVNNSRAYSLPGQDYANKISLDTALARCTAKGAGWHLMTAFEWGALILWCEQNGFIPLGNCAYGKYHTETSYKAIPMTKDGSGNTLHTAGGTGPLEWFHDKTPAGIADLCGNGFEWTAGIRLCYGEVQIMTNNNAADADNSQGSRSAQWKAIDAATGALIDPDVDANGDSTGNTTGSVKVDYVSSKITYSTTITSQVDDSRYCAFKDITCDATIDDTAKAVLQSLGILPISGTLCTTYGRCYINNGAAERAFIRGGHYLSSFSYSFPSFYASYARSLATFTFIGFRAAYCKLPAA